MTTSPFEKNDQSSSPPASQFNWWKSIKSLEKSSSAAAADAIVKILGEMERLYMISQLGVDDLKHKLMVYKSGDFWFPIGGLKKEDMDISPVITVLLLGLSGSGKSSLVNLMYSVLGRSGLIPFAQTSNESSSHPTMILEEHNVLRSARNGFCIYDSRGLDLNRMEEGLTEITRWMSQGVCHNERCRFGELDDVDLISLNFASSDGFVKRKVNYAMVVVDLTDVYKAFFCGGDFKPLVAIKSLFHWPPLRTSRMVYLITHVDLVMSSLLSDADPILILTHGDKLQPIERLNARIKICSYLGVPVTTGAYDIVSLTDQGILLEESDPVTYFALTEAIYRVLLQSDRMHAPKKTYKDWIADILSRIMCSLAYFFAMLSHIFQKWGDKQKMVEFVKILPKKTR